jgi:hypothetical protein
MVRARKAAIGEREMELRQRLERDIGNASDDLWQDLKDHGYVEMALNTRSWPHGYDEMLYRARYLKRLGGRSPAPGRVAMSQVEVRLTEDERRRRDFLSRHLVRVAEQDQRIVAYRDQHLGGQLLSDADAALYSRPPGVTPLDDISESIAQDYGWTVQQAKTYILSGAPPEWSPASVTRRVQRGIIVERRIVLDVAAWMSDDTVVRAFRAAQQETLRRDNRPLSERLLMLFEFVQEHPDLSWTRSAEEWNLEHPKWLYSGPNMQKAYQRTIRALLYMLPVDRAVPPQTLRIRRGDETRIIRASQWKTLSEEGWSTVEGATLQIETLRIRRMRRAVDGSLYSTDVAGGETKLIKASEWPEYAHDDWVIAEVNPSTN